MENVKDPNPPIWQILLKINELRYQVKNSAKFNGVKESHIIKAKYILLLKVIIKFGVMTRKPKFNYTL